MPLVLASQALDGRTFSSLSCRCLRVNVCYGSEANVALRSIYVRFALRSGRLIVSKALTTLR